jgi:hypothetical protein
MNEKYDEDSEEVVKWQQHCYDTLKPILNSLEEGLKKTFSDPSFRTQMMSSQLLMMSIKRAYEFWGEYCKEEWMETANLNFKLFKIRDTQSQIDKSTKKE